VYNLNYNIAIVSVEKSFCHSWPENIFKTNLKLSKQAADTVKSSKKGESSEEKGKSSEKKGKSSENTVVAIGRQTDGVLMGAIGEVKPTNEDRKPSEELKVSTCEELKVSTCEINKVL
jgi:isocitrate/isopropylmalate dehydrogenase